MVERDRSCYATAVTRDGGEYHSIYNLAGSNASIPFLGPGLKGCKCISSVSTNLKMGQTASSVILEGHCEKKYEPVKEKVREMLKNGLEENLQLCVYVDGKCVIDLYGSAIGDRSYNAEKIQVPKS